MTRLGGSPLERQSAVGTARKQLQYVPNLMKIRLEQKGAPLSPELRGPTVGTHPVGSGGKPAEA